MIKANPSTSIVTSVLPSGESSTRAMFDLFWKGSVCDTLLKEVINYDYFVRSKTVSLLPTGDSRSVSFADSSTMLDCSVNRTLPPLNTVPMRFENYRGSLDIEKHYLVLNHI